MSVIYSYSYCSQSMRLQCPTCLELFTPEDDLQCPPCGHVFHRHCIHEWFNYKRASGDREDCPQCRTVTKIQKLRRIYPAEAYDESQEESEEDLHVQIEEIQNQLHIKEGVIDVLLDRVEELQSNLEELELELYEQTKEFKRYQIATYNHIMNNDKVLRQNYKFVKYKSEEPLKTKLRETESQRKEEERGRKQTEKYFFASVAINALLFGLGVSYHYNALLNDV